MDYFKLTRGFWDYAFENPEKIKPNHCALYLFIIEHCNRLGWKKKFGLPTTMAKDAIGIRSYNTYIITLNDLVDFGLIELIEKSKNQYSSNIVAISNFDKALDKALDKATVKHVTKQSESTIQSIDSIDKQYTINNIEERKTNFADSLKPYLSIYGADMLNDFYAYWTESGEKDKKFRSEKEKSFSIERRLETWKRNENKFNPKQQIKQDRL
ncbi:MAG: hypothetical protein RLZZ605_596 [Bacteroidota bacterium]|jgi:hypothetical protein